LKNLFYFSIVLFLTVPVLLTAQDKPLLSEEIRKVVDSQGIEAAKKHFTEQFESYKDTYEIDMNGISEAINFYMNAGNSEAAAGVAEIMAPYMQYMYTSQMSAETIEMLKQTEEMIQAEEEKQKKLKEEEKQISQNNNVVFDKGEARNDLQRFVGLYGDPAEENEYRRLWVMVSCDGYLVAGPLWADTSPWWMKSEGDKSFSFASEWTNVRMEFETDGEGKAVRMIHDQSYIKTPLEFMGPVPEDWGSCIEPPERR
jgi:hypothetical protein